MFHYNIIFEKYVFTQNLKIVFISVFNIVVRVSYTFRFFYQDFLPYSQTDNNLGESLNKHLNEVSKQAQCVL